MHSNILITDSVISLNYVIIIIEKVCINSILKLMTTFLKVYYFYFDLNCSMTVLASDVLLLSLLFFKIILFFFSFNFFLIYFIIYRKMSIIIRRIIGKAKETMIL